MQRHLPCGHQRKVSFWLGIGAASRSDAFQVTDGGLEGLPRYGSWQHASPQSLQQLASGLRSWLLNLLHCKHRQAGRSERLDNARQVWGSRACGLRGLREQAGYQLRTDLGVAGQPKADDASIYKHTRYLQQAQRGFRQVVQQVGCEGGVHGCIPQREAAHIAAHHPHAGRWSRWV